MNEASISITALMSILSLILCYLYAFLNWTLKKNKSRANNYFTWLLINLSLIIIFFMLKDVELDFVGKYLIPLLVTCSLLMPVIFYIYIKRLLIHGTEGRNRKHVIFPLSYGLLLATSMLLVLFGNGQLRDTSFVLFYYGTLGGISVVFLAMNAIYLFLSFRKLSQHRKYVSDVYSYTEKIDLKWVRVMLFGYLFLIAGIVLCQIVVDDFWSGTVFYGTLIAYILYVGNHSLHQKEHYFSTDASIEEKENVDEDDKNDTKEQLFAELKEKLLGYMEEEKPFLDQELTLFKLAKDLDTNTKYLSVVINREFKQSFIHFVNEYRVNAIKQDLVEPKHQNLTIEAMAQNVGFKSKSSFNAAFKRNTGKTPTEYIKSVR
ncbi:MAG: helix-turn-helix domain-containing protein [Bacteroidetes bacterium]|nr:MAG: helix-turn-helix domain-containing protein [Bacteroidota bacterium]